MWKAMGECVRGYTHKKKGLPCQDALKIVEGDGYWIVAVADGHGSAACPFSGDGAEIAVTVAAEVFEDMVKSGCGVAERAEMRDYLAISLPKRVEWLWKERVVALHEKEGRDGGGDWCASRTDAPGTGTSGSDALFLQYGTTLLCLAVTDEFSAALQIGDGDMLFLADALVKTSAPPAASWLIQPLKIFGTETDSLCRRDAWKAMRTRVDFFDETTKPLAFFVCTDGYNNSFASEGEFLRIGADYYDALIQDEDNTRASVAGWLSETSQGGSGDDIALGILYRTRG